MSNEQCLNKRHHTMLSGSFFFLDLFRETEPLTMAELLMEMYEDRMHRSLSYYGTQRASTDLLPDSLSIAPREEEEVEKMRQWRLKMRELEAIVCDMGDRVEELVERLKDSEEDWEAEAIQEEKEEIMEEWDSAMAEFFALPLRSPRP